MTCTPFAGKLLLTAGAVNGATHSGARCSYGTVAVPATARGCVARLGRLPGHHRTWNEALSVRKGPWIPGSLRATERPNSSGAVIGCGWYTALTQGG